MIALPKRPIAIAQIMVTVLAVVFVYMNWQGFRNVLVTFISTHSQTAAVFDFDSALVGHWTFSEGSGASTGDVTIYGNQGILQNSPLWIAGNAGSGALSFNGIDQDVMLSASSTTLNLTGPLTISSWIKEAALPAAYTPVLTKGIESGDAANEQYYLGGSPNGNLVFKVSDGKSDVSVGATSSSTLVSLNQWHHVVGSYNGAGTLALYVDGILADTATSSLLALNTAGADQGVGIGGSTSFWNGSIADVRIYNKVLSSSQIFNLYIAGTSVSATSSSATEPSFFSQPSYTLKVNTTGSGFVSGGVINCGLLCSATFTYGTAVTLAATAADGYVFSMWGGSCSGASTLCNFSMSGNSTVTALFVPISGASDVSTPQKNMPAPVFSIFSNGGAKTLQWKPASYPTGIVLHAILLKKTSDSPANYSFVRVVDMNIQNTGTYTWSPQVSEIDGNYFIEITCGNNATPSQACPVGAYFLRIN
ncbi:MAG: LamG domain-containing protein [bacterium]